MESPRFPDDISYGSRGGPGFATDVVGYGSGDEQRNPRWPVARHKYDVAHGLESEAQLSTLLQFFHIAQGKAYGFRFKDWGDYRASSASNISGTGRCGSGGVGTGEPFLALYKKYGPMSGQVSGPYGIRRITKPVSGSVSIYRNDVLQTVPGQVSIDPTTGTVTLVADFTRNISSISNSSKAIITPTASTSLPASTVIWIDSVAGMTQISSETHYVNSAIDTTHLML